MKRNYNKFAFYGASVTKQTGSYADTLMGLITNQYDTKIEYQKFAHGSMHLSDAGICFIDEVIAYRPEICFIDWFSTAKTDYKDKITKYLDTILLKLLQANVEPVFLLFPISVISDSRAEMYNRIIEYAQEYNVHCINIYQHSLDDNIDISTIIKDYVHTTTAGAAYYAKHIYDYMRNNISEYPDEPLHSNYNIVYPVKNKYSKILQLKFNKTIYKEITIEAKDEIIGMYQTVGPYSGQIEIYNHENKQTTLQNIWDCWCYYERDTFKIPINKPGKYTIKLSKAEFDRTTAKTQIDWAVYEPCIKIKDIYYTQELKIYDYQ